MQELLQVAFAALNLPYTVLLLVVIVYWISVLFGALDISSLDFDLDAEVDVDVDVDLDMDMDADVDSGVQGGNWLSGALSFFNFGKVPFMVVMTFVIVTGWVLTILSNYYLGQGSLGFALAMIVPILFVSLFVAKLATTPLVPLFEHLDGTVEAVDFIGRECKLRLPASASRFGQAEVKIEDDYLLIDVKTESDELSLGSGEKALVVGKTEDKRYYLVRKMEEP